MRRTDQPPDTVGIIATSSESTTGSLSAAGSPFSQTRHVATWAAKAEPYRSQAAATTPPTVDPGTSTLPVPAATRTEAKRRNIAMQPV